MSVFLFQTAERMSTSASTKVAFPMHRNVMVRSIVLMVMTKTIAVSIFWEIHFYGRECQSLF